MRRSVLLLCVLAAFSADGAVAAQFEPKLSFPAKAGEKSVALTFDACAGGFDTRILEALIESKAKATIFVTERWLRGNGANLKLLQSRPDLFQIENHGAHHIPPVTDALTVFGIRSAGTIEAVRDEVEGGSEAIKAATGRRPAWYRGATARYSADALQAIKDMKFRIGGYSLNADKGASLPAGVVAHRMEKAKPGDVVIAHINQPHRPAGAGVAEGVRALARSGWTFVRLQDVEPVEENRRPLIVEPNETDQAIAPAMKAKPKPPAAAPKPEPTKAPAAEQPSAPKPQDEEAGSPPPDVDAAEAAPVDEQPSMRIKPKPGGFFTPSPDQRWPAQSPSKAAPPPGADRPPNP